MQRRQALSLFTASPMLAQAQGAAKKPPAPPPPPPMSAASAATIAELAGDVNLIAETLATLHPGLLRYNAQIQIDATMTSLKRSFAGAPDLTQRFLVLSRFLSMLKCGLLPATQTAMRFAQISYHDYEGVVLDMSMQEVLVRDLGDNNAMIMRNHGLLTVGGTVPEAFNAMHRLELSCRTQLAAMACNSALHPVPAEIVSKTYLNYQPGTRRPFGVLEWPALLRKLDRMDSSYRE